MASNYGGRNGVATVIFFTRQLCRIYTKYSAAITGFIATSTLTSPQKATLTAWLNSATEACMLLETLMVVYES